MFSRWFEKALASTARAGFIVSGIAAIMLVAFFPRVFSQREGTAGWSNLTGPDVASADVPSCGTSCGASCGGGDACATSCGDGGACGGDGCGGCAGCGDCCGDCCGGCAK